MNLYTIIFYLLGAMAVSSAFFAVLSPNLVRAVFALFITLFCMAGLYIYAHADFLAVTQLVIYAGGILILILFGIMLSTRSFLTVRGSDVTYRLFSTKIVFALLCGSIVFVLLINIFGSKAFSSAEWLSGQGSVSWFRAEDIGISLMTKYLLPFEIISIVLLIALAGSAFLARQIKSKTDE